MTLSSMWPDVEAIATGNRTQFRSRPPFSVGSNAVATACNAVKDCVEPMHPEDPWVHWIQSGSVAGVVRAVLGGVDTPEVALTSPAAPGVTHRWTNMTAFTEEVANARIWAGFHYRFSTRVGTDMGLQIGEYVVKNVMQPVVTSSR